MASRHEGVKCDACEANAFRLRRYKCLRCIDFDLCGPCYDRHAEALSHRKNHPMQCLILESDRKIFFPNAKSNDMVRSYTCPICGVPGFKVADLGFHVHEKHSSNHPAVLCPICVYPPLDNSTGNGGGNPNRVHKSFSTHLSEVHRLKNSTNSTHTTIVPNSLSPAAIEAFLTRESDCHGISTRHHSLPDFFEPNETTQRKSTPKSHGRSLLNADEQELFDLGSPSTYPLGQSLRFRLHNPPSSNRPSNSEQIIYSGVIEPRADIRQEAGDEAEDSEPRGVSQSKGNMNTNNEAEENNGNVDTRRSTTTETVKAEGLQGIDVPPSSESISFLIPYDITPRPNSNTNEEAQNGKDPAWESFLHELIWDSLHIGSLSLMPDEKTYN